ncbi:MAG: tyrosine-protein kinase family protein [Deltaproteobacteria bacterium]|nr:MAG: tyrosine-protein kinase family protein [Deltaproteobacteria bacterium]
MTKPYWMDWQRRAGGRTTAERGAVADRGEPARGRDGIAPHELAAIAPPAPQGDAGADGGAPWMLDPRRTIIDQVIDIPDAVRFADRDSAPLPTEQERADVTPGSQSFSDSRQGARGSVPGERVAQPVRAIGRTARPIVSRTPPTVAVAAHGFADAPLDERLIMVREPDSERAAAFRVLRHQVVRHGDPQVIVVTSPLPGEGKTTAAVNLALALGECGRARVLLAEANFTRPCLSAVFGFEPPWCFSQQIAHHRHEADQKWSVVEVPPHGIHVAAADLRSDRVPLVDAPAFAFAIEQMRLAGYDYIVIDAPAVLGSAEVNLLQDAADGVLLVVRGGSSRRRELRAAVEQLAPETLLGVALLRP